MYYPSIEESGNTRNMIDTFLGYNHNYKASAGEFFDMENLSSDNYPLLSPRKVRTNITNLPDDGTEKNFRGILQVGDTVYALFNEYLWNLSTDIQTDLSEIMGDDTESEQTLLVMGSYLLFFPLMAYVNLNDLEDMGMMEAEFRADEGVTISYTPCSVNGTTLQNLTANVSAPNSPAQGDYWICTQEGLEGLYIYNSYKSEWEAVAIGYIKISIPGANLKDYFSEGDAVFMNTKLSDINEGSVIQALDDDYMVVIGFMKNTTDSQTTNSTWTLEVKRKLPRLDVVCADKNRVWGCHYGYDVGTNKVVNEIYASKLGDFKNWYVYQGLSTDSYALTVGDLGDFTGCISFQGCPYFFKENKIYKIYGSFPSEYQLVQLDAEGVQSGSSKSLVVIGDYLLYKGVNDVCVFDGSRPVAISQALSRENLFYDAVAGGCQNKYYVSMETDRGAKRFFVYDMQHGIWEKESALPVLQFTKSIDGQLYALCEDNVYGIGSRNNSIYTQEQVLDEEWVEFYGETGEIGYESPDHSYVSRITLRAFIPARSELRVEVSYDDRPYESTGTIRGNNEIATQSLPFSPLRCDHFKVKISGHGNCRLYSMSFTIEKGSEE